MEKNGNENELCNSEIKMYLSIASSSELMLAESINVSKLPDSFKNFN